MTRIEHDQSFAVRSPADFVGCEAERIHVPGAIQPHGFMLVCSLSSWTIVAASANCGEFLGREASSLLDGHLDSVLPHKAVHDLRNVLQSAMVSGSAERLADVRIDEGDERYDLILHVSGQNAILEILPRAGAVSLNTDPITLVRSMVGRLKRAPTLARFLTLAAGQVRAVTGYDRVMIYKFLEDESGEVVAEALRSGMAPFLGLHYPASDIPAQARALYRRQGLRLIPDIAYAPVPLLSSGSENAEIDLSLATLRSVSPVHLEYLHNMGTRATLTVSLMEGDRLWGLIACHHDVPRRISTSACATAELFGQILSLQITAKDHAQQMDYLVTARQAQDRLLASMPPEENLFDNPAKFHELLQELIPCDGIGVWTDQGFSGAGATPPQPVIGALIRALGQQTAVEPFATDCLTSFLPDIETLGDIAGVLSVPFSRVPRDYLLFFRLEVVQTVTWGGDPNKPMEVGSVGNHIGPRKSFEAWRETVRGKSLPWRPAERQTAEGLRISLLDVIVRRADFVVRERKAAHESQAFLIAELNHRVKNILALIRSVVRQSRPGARNIEDFANDLERRVHAMALAHDQLTSTGWRNAPFRALLDAEAKIWSYSPARLNFEGPPVTLDSRAFQAMALVIHEMMTNAVKHGCLSRPLGALFVSWSRGPEGDLFIHWQERGGPPVAPPERRGFGSVVIEQTIPFELGGHAEVNYGQDGVVARFEVPALHVGEGDSDVQVAPIENRTDMIPLRRLLLVEDSMMIALDAQATLGESGLDVEVAGTTADARRSLKINDFDAVVLDINLSGEMSFGVADDLVGLGLPFVFATGYGESLVIPDRFKAVPVVSKPYDSTALKTALWTMRESFGMNDVQPSGD